MYNIQSLDLIVKGWNVRAMHLENLGWAACLYPSGRGRVGEYSFGDTQNEAVAKLASTLTEKVAL